MRNTVNLDLPDRETPAGWTFRLYPRLSDIDFGGVVHHTVLLRYFEDARMHFLQDQGFSFDQFAATRTIPVVSRLAVEYRSAVILEHKVSVDIAITNRRTRTLTFTCRIWQRDQLCMRAAAELMVTNVEGKGTRMPQALLDVI